MAEKLQVNKIYKDIDLNFGKNEITGDIAKKIDLNAVKQALITLLLTDVNERPFQPGKGMGLRAFLFEPMSLLQANYIEKQIETMINNYEPRAVLENVRVFQNFDDNSYDIEIRFYAKGIGKPAILSTSLKRLI